MFKQAKPFFLIVETPLHAGSGNDLGIVDLPIQREKHTDYPKIEASGLKGCIREIFDGQASKDEIELVFGPEKGNLHAGALGFTDARLLLFPVKSVKGVFAWVTCPAVLERLKQDLSICSSANLKPSTDIEIPASNTVPKSCGLLMKNKQLVKDEEDVKNEENDEKIVLEEYTFSVKLDNKCDGVAAWIANKVLPRDSNYNYWREKVKKDIVVLSDDDFRDFVTLSTEVIARTKIDSNTGTVAKKIGGPWYEEYLPTDSILYSLALTTPLFVDEAKKKGTTFATGGQGPAKNNKEAEKVMNFFANGLPPIIQIGGNATIGKGIVRTHVYQHGGENDVTESDDTQGD